MKTLETVPQDAVTISQNQGATNPNSQTKKPEENSLYQKCLSCKDYGVSCNGPKLAALGDIMDVREFHRAIRDYRAIPMKMIYLATPAISESTINDYFSHSEKDFKWTTVGCIDNAITAICGNRVGQPPLDHPCPASSSEIQQRWEQYEKEIADLKQQNTDLQAKVTEVKGKVIAARDEIKEDYASRVLFLKNLCEQRQQELYDQKTRYEKEIARMDAVAADYLSRIDEKNKRIDKINVSMRIMIFALVVSLLLLTGYLVWDLMHPLYGFFKY